VGRADRLTRPGRLVPIVWIDVLCADRKRGQSVRLAAPFGETGNPADLVQDVGSIVFSPKRCSGQREPLSGTFRGLWHGGFEESRFVPCGARSGVPAEVNGAIWLSLPRDSAAADAIQARFPRGRYRPMESLYIHVHGRLHGPGIFGHLGGSSYELEVDSLVEARRMSWDQCQRLS